MAQHAGRLKASIVSGGQGHSAVWKAAYNARENLENVRLGKRDDYERSNSECLFSGIYAPANSPEWTRDREQLWNHVEAFEFGKRKDAQLARELLMTLPHEMTAEQNRWALQDFIKENFTRKGLVCDLAIHAPPSHGDSRNIHAHLMIVLRKLDGTEFEAGKPRQTLAEREADLEGWKRSLEKHINHHLERHGFEPRWDLHANAERGIDHEPGIHLGKAAAALERTGIKTVVGDLNRDIEERNRLRDELAQLEALLAEQTQAAANENAPEPQAEYDPEAAYWASVEAQAAEDDYYAGTHDIDSFGDEDVREREEFEASFDVPPDWEARVGPSDYEPPPEQAVPESEAAEAKRFNTEWKTRQRKAEPEAPHWTERDVAAVPESDAADFQTTLEAINARAAEIERGSMDYDAKRAMDDMARTDPHGTARLFGHHAGDRLKTPEQMRAEWAANLSGRAAAPDPTPEREAVPDPTAARIAWAERLRDFARQVPEMLAEKTARLKDMAERLEAAFDQHRSELAARFREKAQGQDAGKTVEVDASRAAWVENLRHLDATPTPRQTPQREEGPGRGTQAGRVVADDQPEATQRPSHEVERLASGQKSPPEAKKQPAAEQPRRPAERAKSFADDLLAQARAEIDAARARETPEQRAERERQEQQRHHGRGDGSRQRDRHHHQQLHEALHPFQHRHPRHHPRRLD